MSRDGSGTMSTDTMATASAVASSTTVNSIITDIANALTDSINKDGTKAWAANQSVGNNKFTSLGSGSARTDSINFGQVQDGKANWVDGGGTADAITATYSPAITALVDGQICFVRATAANATTTPTFAPNGLTARTIVKHGGVALAVGDIVGDGHELALRYDLTNTRWELLNPSVILTDYAALATANTFTAVQTIGVANAGTNTVTDVLAIRHTTSGTAAAGFGTGFVYRLEDGGGTTTDAASIDAVWVDATDTSEDSKISFKTMVAGSAKAEAAYFGQGLVVGSATGGDQGAGTVNATALYINGTAVSSSVATSLGLPTTVFRVTDSSITSNTTLASDSVLKFAMLANTAYDFEAWLLLDIDADSGWKLGTTGPASPTEVFIYAYYEDDNGTNRSSSQTSYAQLDSNTPGADRNGGIRIKGLIRNGANAGDFALQFAQATSHATAFVIKRGSRLSYRVNA